MDSGSKSEHGIDEAHDLPGKLLLMTSQVEPNICTMRTALGNEIPDKAEKIFIHPNNRQTRWLRSASVTLQHVFFQVDALDRHHSIVEWVQKQISYSQFASLHLLDREPFCDFAEVIAGVMLGSPQIPAESLRKVFEAY